MERIPYRDTGCGSNGQGTEGAILATLTTIHDYGLLTLP
jgi:hypothetical protein